MKKYKMLLAVTALLAALTLSGCKQSAEGEEVVTDTNGEAVTATTAVTTGIEAIEETLPPETMFVVETVPLKTTAETTVTTEEVTEETTTVTTVPVTEETTYSYPIITYPTPSYPVYPTPSYPVITTPVVTEAEPYIPTDKELLTIAKKGFAGIVYSDDERILNYTNVALYCTLVGNYQLDPVNENNSKNTIDLNDARKQLRERLTPDLTSVEFLKVDGQLTKGELQVYNKKLRYLYSGGDVLNVKTGFPFEATSAYKITFTYDLIETEEHIYEEPPYFLVVELDGEWVLDICKPLLEETHFRTDDYYEDIEAQKLYEELKKIEEEELKKQEEEAKKKQKEFEKQQEEYKKKMTEYEKAVFEYKQKEQERNLAREAYNQKIIEFNKLENEFLEATADYEKLYEEYLALLESNTLDKQSSQFLYYTTSIRNYEVLKKQYEKAKADFEKATQKHNQEEQAWEKYQFDFFQKWGYQ